METKPGCQKVPGFAVLSYIYIYVYLLMRLFVMLQVVFLGTPKTYLPYRRSGKGLVGLRNLAAPKPQRDYRLNAF